MHFLTSRFCSSGPIPSASNPFVGTPFLGRTVNGVAANSSAVQTPLIFDRISTTISNLGSAALQGLGTTDVSPIPDAAFLASVQNAYAYYLNSLASTALFESTTTPMNATVYVPQDRLIIT